jgi:toxin YoeB
MANREVLKKPSQRDAVFDPIFREDLIWFVKNNRKAAIRTLELVEAILADPFVGIGKPEALKFELAGSWSRRITQEHRLGSGSSFCRRGITINRPASSKVQNQHVLFTKSSNENEELFVFTSRPRP